MKKRVAARKPKRKWYEKYLPFIARSPEMQIEWLIAAFRKGVLSPEEVTPYIRLLLEDAGKDKLAQLAALIPAIDDQVLDYMVCAADVYDIPKLLALLPAPTVRQAVSALGKVPPPYERKPNLALDRVFQAINAKPGNLLEKGVEALRNSGDVPDHFEGAYERFQEIMEDERILTSLFPKARA